MLCCGKVNEEGEYSENKWCALFHVASKPEKPSTKDLFYHVRENAVYLYWGLEGESDALYKTCYIACIIASNAENGSDSRLKCCPHFIPNPEAKKTILCKTSLDTVSMPQRIRVEIIGYHVAGHEMTVRGTNLSAISKLESISHLHGNASSRNISLLWKSGNYTKGDQHEKYQDVQFYFRSYRGESSKEIVTLKEEDINHFVIDNLLPHTNYTIFLRLKYQDSLVWSDWANKAVQTKSDVPGANPLVMSGGFDSIKISQDLRNVTLYWQAVPESLQYGTFKGYLLNRIYQGQQLTYSTKFTKYTFHNLLLEEEVKLSVVAENSEGTNHDLPVIVITVPPESQVAYIPENFTVIVENKSAGNVAVSWATPSMDICNITVFYCKIHIRSRDCESAIYWRKGTVQKEPSVMTLQELPGHPSEYNYGLSVTQCCQVPPCASSGINWMHQLFYLEELGNRPRVKIEEESKECKLILEEDRVGGHRGYVYAFKVTYCPVGADDQCMDKEKVLYIPTKMSRSYHTIKELQPEQAYKLTVASVAVAGESSVIVVSFVTKQVLISTPLAVIIAVVAVVLLILFIIGIIVCIRCQLRLCRKAKKLMHIPISLPPISTGGQQGEGMEGYEDMDTTQPATGNLQTSQPVTSHLPVLAVPPFPNPDSTCVSLSEGQIGSKSSKSSSCLEEIPDENKNLVPSGAGPGDQNEDDKRSSNEGDLESACPYSKLDIIDRERNLSLIMALSPSPSQITALVPPCEQNLTKTMFQRPKENMPALCVQESKQVSAVVKVEPISKTSVETSPSTAVEEESPASADSAWFPFSMNGNIDLLEECAPDQSDGNCSDDSCTSDHDYASGKQVNKPLIFPPLPPGPAAKVGQTSGTSSSIQPIRFVDIPEGPAKDPMGYNLPGATKVDTGGGEQQESCLETAHLISKQGENNNSEKICALAIGQKQFSPAPSPNCSGNFTNHLYAGGNSCGDLEEEEEEEEDEACDEDLHIYAT